jgi:hypothetical protein
MGWVLNNIFYFRLNIKKGYPDMGFEPTSIYKNKING